MQRFWLKLALLTWVSSPALAQSNGSQRKIMFGTCELSLDPATPEGRENLGVLSCIKASLGTELVFVSGTPEENSWLKYGNIYGGLFLTPWLAVQARGKATDQIPLGDVGEENRNARTDYAVVQIGNPALQRVRMTAGRMRLPFGVDRTEAPENYRVFEDRRFWQSPEHGAALTFDNLTSFQADIGYGTNAYADRTIPDAPSGTDENEPLKTATTIRIMADFAALDGSRLVLSGYGGKDGERRMGAAFTSVSRKEDLTVFEFVRRLTTPSGHSEPFSQLLRMAYVGAWRGDTRWVVQFDDERYRFRRGIIDYDAKLYDHAILRFGVAYHKSESGDDQRRWYVTSGMEARL